MFVLNYLKLHICHHVIGIAIKLKVVTPPKHSIDLQFNKKQTEEEIEQQKVVKHLYDDYIYTKLICTIKKQIVVFLLNLYYNYSK